MDYKNIAKRIIDLRDADLALRQRLVQNGLLGEGYNEEMEELHNRNATLLNDIIDKIGYPTIDKVGEEASEAAWLVIQHAIGQPNFMKRCRELLKTAVSEHRADPRSLAYLTDRIAVFEGKPQLYGTQFDWDENGELSPARYDRIDRVNKRRRAIGLNTLEEQTILIRQRAKHERETPPKDMDKRKHQADAWKRKVGWAR
ncbi:hypothetical protein JHJ32_11415 [Parapedobacter sp. ISTM3]|uniref:Uncharacterized protein n=1 Tax=Parapedobacter luteus TaxID=623280 RepID=A0A1T5CZ42_9SPHI|nr:MULTISPECIES: DUF6624 domain-containing protein [Parapedobacter]MBK1440596.1 hypothetical protein [Parapedobacter sp. ISTM3]SKB64788.1 hypothetical protein SAMN05660226_02493 [Parapedobacter luteus]